MNNPFTCTQHKSHYYSLLLIMKFIIVHVRKLTIASVAMSLVDLSRSRS